MIGVNSVSEEITVNEKQIWQGSFWLAQQKICVIGKDHVEVRKYLDEQISEYYRVDMKVEKPDISMKSHRVDGKLIINVTGRDSKTTDEIFQRQLKRLEELLSESDINKKF